MATVLLLHGQPGSTQDWERVRPLLSSYDVLVPARPGYDGSAPADLWRNADFAARTLDEAAADTAIVVGHSWGAAAALAAAIRHPARISGLVLITPVGNAAALEWFDHLAARPLFGRVTARVLAEMDRHAMRLAIRSTGSVLGRDVVADLHREVEERDSHAVWRAWRLEQRALVEQTPYLQDRLAEVTQPVVVVAGTRDRVVTPRMARDLVDRLPKARYVEVDAGHLLPRECPDAVVDAIRQVG